MSILDPFSTDRCCQTTPSHIQELTADYYSAISSQIDKLMTEVYQAELYGKDTNTYYNLLNDFHYLYSLCVIIYYERINDAQWDLVYGTGCGVDNGVDYYTEKYNIDCIKKRFFCNGYDISNALNVFNLDPESINLDGIGYMSIGFTSPSKCEDSGKVFRVF